MTIETESAPVVVTETAPVETAPVAAPAETEAAPVDTAPAAAAEPPPPDPRTVKAFAEIARREKALTQKQKEAETALAKATELEGLVKLAKADPVAFFEKAGLDLRSVVDAHIKHGQPPSVEDKVSALERQIAEEKAARESERKAAEEAAAKRAAEETAATEQRATAQVADLVKSAGDRFELTNLLGEQGEVFALMKGDWEQQVAELKAGRRRAPPQLMTWEDAAAKVEAYLEERFAPVTKAKKFAPKPSPVVEPPKPALTKKPVSPTITNRSAAGPSVPTQPVGGKLLSARELAEKFRKPRA